MVYARVLVLLQLGQLLLPYVDHVDGLGGGKAWKGDGKGGEEENERR